jgi:hypothetical protein
VSRRRAGIALPLISHRTVTTTQRVAVTVGIPLLDAVMATPSGLVAGIHLLLRTSFCH